jgi:cobalt-zinc-cadmium efflux system outer membrane protein
MHRAHSLGALLFAALLVVPLEAQTRTVDARAPLAEDPNRDTIAMSLAEARRLALAQNPRHLAALQRLEAARGDLRGARTYPFNPEAEIEGPGSLSAGSLQRYEARLAQEVEWAGQGRLRVDAAEAGLRATAGSVLDEVRLLLADIERSYVALAAAEERLALAREIETLNARLVEAVRIELAEGEISVLEANLAEIEVGRARARVLAARREAVSARLALSRLVGALPETPIRADAGVAPAPAPESLDPDALLVAALDQRPDLAAAVTAVRQSETLTSLARREAIPNLRIAALAERESIGGEPRFGIGVGLPLPFWDRNQGLVARRRAETEQTAYALEAVRLRVRTEVADAYRSYVAAAEEAAVFEADVLEPAHQNQELLETAYQAGKLDLSALVLLRNQLLDAELAYWDAWLAQREALVRLRAATGELSIDDLNGEDG